jgi:hypothetical protein
MASYRPSSPYYNTRISNGVLGLMNNRKIPKMIDDQSFTITQTYNLRPDLLAFDLYGDPGLWWVFANRNPNQIADPLGDFVTGITIYLPKQSTLKNVLGI